MKLLRVIFLLAYLSVSMAAIAEDSAVDAVADAAVAGSDIEVSVNGMVCAFCAKGIKKKFFEHESVSGIDVSLSDKIVKISLKEGMKLEDSEIEELIKDSGYDLKGINRAGSVGNSE